METMKLQKQVPVSAMLDPKIVVPAIGSAFVKLDPRLMIKNPVMFVVEIVAALTTVIFLRDLVTGGANLGFTFQIILWLWFTVLFANFAEAVAEGRGKAQAESLKKTRTESQAKLLSGSDKDYRLVPGTSLKVGDIVLVEAGDNIPSDGEVIVNVALPSIQHQLHTTPGGLEWVVSAYALSLAALIPLGGTLGDHYGRKKVFLVGVVVFTAASAGCALSVTSGMLIGFRVVQGIGGAVMSSLTLSLITEAYPLDARTGPIGLWASVGGLGVAFGTVLGGLLLSVFSWSSIFWVNLPVGLLCVLFTLIGVSESRDPVPRTFDTPGVLLSAAGLFLVTFGFVDSSDASWRSPQVGICIAAGVLLLIGFVLWEHRAESPMVPISLFRTSSFGRSCGVYLLAYLAFTGFIYYVTLFFQNVVGWSALRTGLSWLFFCIPYFVVAQLSRQVARRMSKASAVGWGCVVAAGGVLGMSQLGVRTPFAWAAGCYVLVGIGFALMVPASSAAAMSTLPEGSSGIGSGLFNAVAPDRHCGWARCGGIDCRRHHVGYLALADHCASRRPADAGHRVGAGGGRRAGASRGGFPRTRCARSGNSVVSPRIRGRSSLGRCSLVGCGIRGLLRSPASHRLTSRATLCAGSRSYPGTHRAKRLRTGLNTRVCPVG